MYWWAFNPPHLDHAGKDGIIGKLLDSLTEKVLIIPTGNRNDKTYHGVSDRDRLNMLRLATEEYGANILIDDILIRGEIPSTTLAQAEYLKKKYGYEVAQVFGADVAPNMIQWDPTWYVAKKLPKIFVSRPWHTLSGVENYELLPFESRGFSSTDIRVAVSNSVPVDVLKNKIHANVLDYILENRLFSPV